MADVKICGIKTPDILETCIEVGTAYVGLVFFEKSPRHVSLDQAAELARLAGDRIQTVGLMVNPSLDFIKQHLDDVALDYIQLHGKESPEFCQLVRDLGIKVIKAVSVGAANDIRAAQAYHQAVDMMLYDAKPSEGADLPGGNAESFDWHLMKDQRIDLPWMLAGGLHASNAAQAVSASGATILDLSSGVESSRGVKDPDKIRAFVAAARNASL